MQALKDEMEALEDKVREIHEDVLTLRDEAPHIGMEIVYERLARRIGFVASAIHTIREGNELCRLY